MDLIFIRLTEAGTQKGLSLQASLIGGIMEDTRGNTEIWTKLMQDGDSKVFVVEEEVEDILKALNEAYLSLQKEEKKYGRK